MRNLVLHFGNSTKIGEPVLTQFEKYSVMHISSFSIFGELTSTLVFNVSTRKNAPAKRCALYLCAKRFSSISPKTCWGSYSGNSTIPLTSGRPNFQF